MERDSRTDKDIRDGGPKLRRTTRTASQHERRSAEPTAGDMTNPGEVWKEAETTPQESHKGAGVTGHGRIADAGDIGGGAKQPYDVEKQADMVGRQTDRRKADGGTSKPTRPKR